MNPTERIYKLEREVLEFQAATAPLGEALEELCNRNFAVVPEALHEYFRDVEDHLRRVSTRIENFRQLLDSALEANLTQVSMRQNEDMRKISAWVAIAVVPTAIAGIYGMNFEHMPELEWTLGYPAVLAPDPGRLPLPLLALQARRLALRTPAAPQRLLGAEQVARRGDADRECAGAVARGVGERLQGEAVAEREEVGDDVLGARSAGSARPPRPCCAAPRRRGSGCARRAGRPRAGCRGCGGRR